MAVRQTTASWQRAFLISGSLVLIVAALYFARSVLIPVVLAILLAFVLSPLVIFLQRRGLPRVVAVVAVVLLALAILGGVGYAVVSQVRNLILDLPQHKNQIAQKLHALRQFSRSSWIDNLTNSVKDIEKQAKQLEEPGPGSQEEQPPMPVRVESSSFPFVQSVVGSAIEFLVSLFLVIVLVAFMLIKREDLRNRVIRLWGDGSVTSMTRALDDATIRISRFLLMQLLVNSSFGACVALGVWLIGVPYPALWGFLAACLRYLPYIGPWVGCFFPFVLSIAVLPGWTPPVLVFCLFLVLELVISNVIEPSLYGQSIGVSEVALLIAAAFWTWLWGPIGLVLSTPLTACLAVLGRYVPNLEFFGILLGDEPALEPHVMYYQRLLARDQDEATELVEEFTQSHDSETVFDEVLIPALILARRNQERGLLSEEDIEYIQRVTRELLEEVFLPQSFPEAKAAPSNEAEASAETITVFGCPAYDDLDELTLEMLQHLLGPVRCRFEVLSPDALTAEVVARVRADQAPVVCIGALPPQNLAHTRYLCKRLRGQFPGLKIVVGCWGWEGERDKITQRLSSAGADQVALSLLDARTQIMPLVQSIRHADAPPDLAQTA